MIGWAATQSFSTADEKRASRPARSPIGLPSRSWTCIASRRTRARLCTRTARATDSSIASGEMGFTR